MQSLAERAKSYARGCELRGKAARAAEFDYIAGAKEERILVVEWLEREVDADVLAKFKECFKL